MRSHILPRGITKLELLVVFVCVTAIFCLLLPGLDFGSRDASRRVQCASRIGELVRSFQQFELAKKQYPGYLNAYGQVEQGAIKVGTWAVVLLPYIEQEDLYDAWQDPSTTAQWNRWGGGSNEMNHALYPKVSVFMCSSDTRTREGAFSSFAVNCGYFPASAAAYPELDPHEIARRSSHPANGVFSNQLPGEVNCLYTKNEPRRVLGSRANAPTRTGDIHDGLTHTIAIAESMNADAWSYVGRERGWDTIEVKGQLMAGDDLNAEWSPRVHGGVVWQYKAQPPKKGVPNYIKPKQTSFDKPTFKPELAIPSSYHNGGVNTAMLGGAVYHMNKEIDYRVLQALLTPHTEESDVPDPRFVLKPEDYE